MESPASGFFLIIALRKIRSIPDVIPKSKMSVYFG